MIAIKRIVLILVIVLILLSCFLARECLVPQEKIVKSAVRMNEIKGEYILCRRIKTTGFNWYVTDANCLYNECGYCQILGANPFLELPLSYDFFMADNTFVFYVESRREYYSEEMRENVIEYTVSGWDVLYPVKHEAVFGILKSPKYILTSDLVGSDIVE